METFPTIKYIEPFSDYRLFVIFDNGVIKVYSMKEKLESPAFRPLHDITLFNQAHAASGGYGVVWNDRIDLSEYELWKNGVEISSVEKLVSRV